MMMINQQHQSNEGMKTQGQKYHHHHPASVLTSIFRLALVSSSQMSQKTTFEDN